MAKESEVGYLTEDQDTHYYTCPKCQKTVKVPSDGTKVNCCPSNESK